MGLCVSNNDELLFGAELASARDSDGDGVSDVQERLDGTDPNDAADSIRHDHPAVNPSQNRGDPRGDVSELTLDRETVVDVAASRPAGVSLDQALPTGLDGKPIPTGPRHYGNADADKLLDGRTGDPSPAGVQRDPTVGGAPAVPPTGRDSVKDTLGRDSGPSSGDSATFRGGGTVHAGPPPGEPPSGSADPDHNIGLVSADDKTNSSSADLLGFLGLSKTQPAPKVDPGEKFKSAHDAGTTLPKLKEFVKPKYVDPDAVDGTVVPTEEQLEHVVAVHGGATDVVQGYGGAPQIEGDAPPKPIDFVRDPAEPKGFTDGSTPTVAPAGQEISHTINPNDGIVSGRGPSAGPGPGAGGGDGDGDENGMRASYSSPATAADSSADVSADSSADASGITLVGSGSTGGGIQTVGDDVTGTGSTTATSDSGTVSQSAMMAGGDNHLEALEVQRADLAAGTGTQTEDEVYVDALDAPVNGLAGGADTPTVDTPAVDTPTVDMATGEVGTVAQVVAPVVDVQVVVDAPAPLDAAPVVDMQDIVAVPVPLDPVADAMATADVAPFEAPADSFSGLEVNDDLAIPDEVDLDDGL